jgi:uncharacterized protein
LAPQTADSFTAGKKLWIGCSSSLDGKANTVETFFRTVYQRARATGFSPPVREFESAWQSIERGRGGEQNCQVWPYRMFVVGASGEFTTFSPELLGMESAIYGSFSLGNVMTDSPRAIAGSKKLQRLFKDVQKGVKHCQATCEYFQFCGGGAPSNKLFETGTLTSATTRFCASAIQLPLRIVLEDVESTLVVRDSRPHDFSANCYF